MDLTVALIAAIAALAGVYVGGHQQTRAWRRDKRLQAALDMLTAVDAFLFTLPTADRARQEQAGERLLRAHVVLALVGPPAVVKAAGRCVYETRRLLFERPSPEQAIAITAQLQTSRNDLIDKAGAALGFRERVRTRKRRALTQGS